MVPFDSISWHTNHEFVLLVGYALMTDRSKKAGNVLTKSQMTCLAGAVGGFMLSSIWLQESHCSSILGSSYSITGCIYSLQWKIAQKEQYHS